MKQSPGKKNMRIIFFCLLVSQAVASGIAQAKETYLEVIDKMIDSLKKFFGRSSDRTVDRRETALHDIQIATCALLLEMATIDGEFNASEKERIISILKMNYSLSDEDATVLIEAADEEVKKSVDMWQFTNFINQNYSKDEKKQVIETVWQVIYADGRLDKHEDYLVHKLAKLLRLSHKELIDAKLKIIHSE